MLSIMQGALVFNDFVLKNGLVLVHVLKTVILMQKGYSILLII